MTNYTITYFSIGLLLAVPVTILSIWLQLFELGGHKVMRPIQTFLLLLFFYPIVIFMELIKAILNTLGVTITIHKQQKRPR